MQVRIQAAGVCHSDLSVINGTIPFPAPAVLGHEGAGVVEAVGSGVTSVKPGDHVVIATLASCGTCRACSTGHPTMCKSSLGNISTPFTYKGEPASNFAAASVFSELTVVAEVQAVRQALAVARGNLSRASELLGVTRPTLYDLLEKHRISPAQFGKAASAHGDGNSTPD